MPAYYRMTCEQCGFESVRYRNVKKCSCGGLLIRQPLEVDLPPEKMVMDKATIQEKFFKPNRDAPEVVISELFDKLAAAEELDSELRAELTEMHEKLEACEVDWASAYALVCTRAEAAEAQCAALEQCVAAWQKTACLGEEHWRRALNAEWDLRHQVETQCAAMREALEEHVRVGPHRTYCLRCDAGGRSEMGHSSGCLIGKALATDAGAKMLAEVKRLRWLETFLHHRRATGEGDDGWAASIDYALGKLDAEEVRA